MIDTIIYTVILVLSVGIILTIRSMKSPVNNLGKEYNKHFIDVKK